jgi:phosphoribosylamine---glycine ligase
MQKEKVAVIDGGGRGSVLVDRYLRSPHVAAVIAIPGNDMMGRGQGKPVETFQKVRASDVGNIVTICKDWEITLVDIAHERAVCAGLTDALRREGISVVGPTAKAGNITEGDKAASRLFGTRHGLPQPEYHIFDTESEEGDDAVSYVKTRAMKSMFVKAAFLCDGKGAIPVETKEEAEAAINHMAVLPYNAGRKFLIEEWLKSSDGKNGEEFSMFCLSDGTTWNVIGSAQDHKRLWDHDKGPNTGGMGCSTPPLVLRPEIQAQASEIMEKVFTGLKTEGIPYTGILYLGGIIINQNGKDKVYVVEFNARWGDPEAQVILPGIKTDPFEISKRCADGQLGGLEIETDGRSRVSVAGVALGYPESYKQAEGKRIYGLDRAGEVEGVTVYGAGVKVVDGKHYVSGTGGRLFHIVGEGKDVLEAKERVYSAMARVFVEGNNLHYRTDIGHRDVERILRA